MLLLRGWESRYCHYYVHGQMRLESLYYGHPHMGQYKLSYGNDKEWYI